MLKYLGGALFVAAGWLLGNSIQSVYSDRIALLERFRDFVRYCESEINYYKTAMDDIIDKFTDKNNKYDAILFDSYNKNLLVSKETAETIKGYFIGIKTLDSESQKGFFSETLMKTDRLIENAKRDLNVKGKMLKKLAPIAAIGIFILTL